MSKSSVITVDNKETGKKENVYWKEEKYYYGEKLIESIQKRCADHFGGLVWKVLPDTHKSGLDNPPEPAVDYDDMSEAIN
ncbi:MAG: hypothetical protein F6K25_22710 [Okeania sp. SIO2G4]|uniref:hypothetical protein n=1 Tax=unclassified Okeania TaxID=2634635 RepID=UPI0013B7F9F7|nr:MULTISPECIES: hypothetical protein [unclassified Okeania]NEP41315.1 hypothetical protein [Okeania sp. SIO2H7]NEP74508.1 hypothetical protein [Okeania sp. SIO2G5]NEP95582.1 hypothetical protein [Okeania sp. SIO2F5]NEQ93323.1 hypothetical protein [Okeania sp. SIO2G4]